MPNETIGRYLLKLREKINAGQVNYVDMYEIGEEIGLVDRIQTAHIVEMLSKDGYITNDNQNSKINLTDKGIKKLRSDQT